MQFVNSLLACIVAHLEVIDVDTSQCEANRMPNASASQDAVDADQTEASLCVP